MHAIFFILFDEYMSMNNFYNIFGTQSAPVHTVIRFTLSCYHIIMRLNNKRNIESIEYPIAQRLGLHEPCNRIIQC